MQAKDLKKARVPVPVGNWAWKPAWPAWAGSGRTLHTHVARLKPAVVHVLVDGPRLARDRLQALQGCGPSAQG